jgi:hypothetical protein
MTTKEQVIDTDGQILTKIADRYGRVEYLNTKGQFHRIGGPAIIWSDGSQSYYVNGKLNRTDGPTYIRPNGYQAYLVNGKLHRIGGPAVIIPDGTVEYYLDGIKYTQEEYPQAVIAYKLKQLVG